MSDTGGIDDKGFNQNAYDGLKRAETELGVEIAFLESSADTDYEPNINALMEQGCDLVVTVGFLLGDATREAALLNPEQLFAIVDYAYDPPVPNIRAMVFDTASASMLQGYLAAGMTTTGVVGTFGGAKIPTVTDFMDGFVAGVKYYNEQNGRDVSVVGWNPATQEGVFTDDFNDLGLGREKAEALMQADADIIFAVAGPAGQGGMAAVQDNPSDLSPKPLFIGVDVDQYISVPGYEDIMLSSELKRMDTAVFEAVKEAMDLTSAVWTTNMYVGTLVNEGVGMAAYHDFEDAVPAALKAEVDALKAALIDGSVTVAAYSGKPAPSAAP
ncbi:MAG: BMP family ABC transporter substrate-binding protein [Chloroflexota bacterium]|nr:BMP family ABC transporter substrate-binding protein [Chloroflexota bacterium]